MSFEVRDYENGPRHFSQFQEDPVLLALVRRLNPPHSFLEIGAGDGSENCTRVLAEVEGWTGLWIDASYENCVKAKAIADPLGVQVQYRRVALTNVAAICMSLPQVIGVLSLDIDGNDYWIWQGLCEGRYRLRPAICVVECQIQKPRDEPYIMDYIEDYQWNNLTHDCGASVFSMKALGAEMGYTLVGMLSNEHAPNAFFVRNDLMGRLNDNAAG